MSRIRARLLVRWTLGLALLGSSQSGWSQSPEERDQLVPWSPVGLWGDFSTPQSPLQVHIGLAGGFESNHFRLSTTEQRILGTASSGAILSDTVAIWPSANVAGPLIAPAIDVGYARELAGQLTTVSVHYEGSLPLAGWRAQSHPIRVQLQRPLFEAGKGKPVWLSF